ncbi:MAG: ParB/RepB/Spo0J family partition protein [Candidatus Marinimicrobia bacterium]|nr:ParB/RepB/Spo0J family partition protein [Candidatus Neomarinimicrobiota bacterium]MDP6593517.1 ParB/RepB/Spo0J family partition protein [Candidatus Neomarinimicrobiota bacterium]MDP6836327.1 ParB/RepB/Spo0J family partition protein [Candidatus Neomarinimicrobiota bacterium]MDP6966499.1 ParB/RepB/Spo0J family partition protein [Candidatus Neomarinimicrobiota bacterium]
MTTKRLGRGLSALIRETTEETVDSGSVLQVALDLVSPNPHQPRQEFDKKSLEELAYSIIEKGIIQPITVRNRNGGYEIIVGERRWRAARIAGLTDIPARVLEIDDDAEMMEYALIENIQRENLNVIEEAEAYAVLNKQYGFSHTQIAKAVGKNRVTVSNTLRLLKLPQKIKESLRKGQITAGHARALLALKNSQQMLKLWKRIVERQESVRTTEELVAQLVSGAPVKGRKKKRIRIQKSSDMRQVEDDLISILGTKVNIRSKSKGGIIEVEYYSDSDLERLLDLFAEIEE